MGKQLDTDVLDQLFNVQKSSKTLNGGSSEMEIDKLVPFSCHPFRMYEGKRLTDMVQSIKENGVMIPVIVRSLDNGYFEILAGHNRTHAAKLAGLDKVPAIIREGLSDDEALIIVTESNTNQRSVSDMLPSELARALLLQLEAYKRMKRRKSLVDEVEKTLESSDEGSFGEKATMSPFSSSREVVANQNGFGKDQLRFYLRLNHLIPEVLDRVDHNEISLRAALHLSYLKQPEQELLNQLLDNGEKVDMAKAELLRTLAEKKMLNEEIIKSVLSKTYQLRKKTQKRPIRLSPKFIDKFFDVCKSQQEITTLVETAVAFYLDYLKQLQTQVATDTITDDGN